MTCDLTSPPDLFYFQHWGPYSVPALASEEGDHQNFSLYFIKIFLFDYKIVVVKACAVCSGSGTSGTGETPTTPVTWRSWSSWRSISLPTSSTSSLAPSSRPISSTRPPGQSWWPPVEPSTSSSPANTMTASPTGPAIGTSAGTVGTSDRRETSWENWQVGSSALSSHSRNVSDAFRAEGSVRFGLYHSLYEWYHPLYLADKENNLTTRTFVSTKVLPELVDLVTQYRPEVLWSDGDWEAHPDYWDSLQFLSWLYSSSPVKDSVVTNDRWGVGVLCKHGDFFTCSDRYNPGVLQPHKWENAMTIDRLTSPSLL